MPTRAQITSREFDRDMVYGDWRERANCLGMDTNLFFSDEHTHHGKHLLVIARKTCTDCPVRTECLLAALEMEGRGARYGVYGGLTAGGRDALVARKLSVVH